MESNQVLALVLVPLLFLSLAATSTNFLIASTSEEEEASSSGLPFTTLEPTTSVPPAATTTAAAANESADYVRARVQLFGIPSNSPDIVAWITVPNVNATGAVSINATELEASNNVTDDGMGEVFMALPNVTSAINQQIKACALDVVALTPHCDNAFTSNATASTVLQIFLGNPQAAAVQ